MTIAQTIQKPLGDSEPSSYWQATVTPMALADTFPVGADVAVVGGGLLGAAATYWLARAGVRPILLERSSPACGATGRNGGFVTVGPAEGYRAAVARHGRATIRAIYQLTLENRALLRQILREEQIACDYREPGNLSLALDEAQYTGLAKTVAALTADGFAAKLLDRLEVQQLIKTPLGSEIVGGLFIPDTGLLHSARLVHGLVDAARQHGARTVDATVAGLTMRPDGVTLSTDRGPLGAGSVVIAANAWLDQLVPSLANLVVPVRGQMLAYAPIGRVFEAGLGAALTSTGEYWQQTVDGSIVLGGCRAAAPGFDVGVRESRPTAEVQMALEHVMPRLFPELQNLRVTHRWAGLMAFTPDYLPIAGRVPGTANVWVVGGFCGHGMPFGIRLGQLLAEGVIAGSPPAALAPLGLERATLKTQAESE